MTEQNILIAPAPGDSRRTAIPTPGRLATVWIAMGPVLTMAWLLFFYAYCFRVWLGLGRLPQSIAEHAGLNGSWHHRAAWLSLGILAWLSIAWTISVVAGVAFLPRLRRAWVVAALLVPWAAWAYLAWMDFGHWFDWFLD